MAVEGCSGWMERVQAAAAPMLAAPAQQAPAPDAGQRGAEGSTPLESRILIVDDNPAIHDDFRLILLDSRGNADRELEALSGAILGTPQADTSQEPADDVSFEIDSAFSGAEALRKVQDAVTRGAPFAVCFLDVRMPPGWDGVVTMRKLWEADPELYIVLCTAYADYSWAEIHERSRHSERLLILKKPFEVDEVRQLAYALSREWHLARGNQRHLAVLEQRVADSAAALEAANEQLRRAVAERELAQGALQRAERLEALGRLAAGIGHEINNPLNFILGSVEVLSERIGELTSQIPDQTRQELDELAKAALVGGDRIAEIVRSIQKFVRPSEEPNAPVDVRLAMELALRMSAPQIGAHVQVTADLAEVPPALGKRVELEQIFINLIKNAAQALAAQKDRPARISLSCRQEGDMVVAVVADTGPGIPAQHRQRIFDPFFTTKPGGQGSGLGLAISQTMVSAMGGSIEVESELGQGTSVRVRLSVASGEVPGPGGGHQPEPPPSPASPTVPGRVLLVEDEPLLLHMMAHALAPHEVVCAASGREALALCESEHFDAILCDLVMLDTSGMDFYEQLAVSRPELAERILFMTGAPLIEDVQAFLETVPNAYIEKPVSLSNLRARVDEMVHRRVAASRQGS